MAAMQVAIPSNLLTQSSRKSLPALFAISWSEALPKWSVAMDMLGANTASKNGRDENSGELRVKLFFNNWRNSKAIVTKLSDN